MSNMSIPRLSFNIALSAVHVYMKRPRSDPGDVSGLTEQEAA